MKSNAARNIVFLLIALAAPLPAAFIGVFPLPLFFLSEALLFSAALSCVFSANRVWKRLFLLMLAAVLAVTAFDLALRPIIHRHLHYRPNGMFIRQWEKLSGLYRYDGNVSWEGDVYGDLAAMSGKKDFRQVRHISFFTDAYGFRNRDFDPEVPIDVIALGDSFGVGNGTDQEAIWPERLRDMTGLNVYNLSFPATPEEEYANLAVELPRMKTSDKPVVLWILFSGNDLGSRLGSPLDIHKLKFNGLLSRIETFHKNLRARSPIKTMISRLLFSDESAAGKVIARSLPSGQPLLFYLPHSRALKLSREQALANRAWPAVRESILTMQQLCDRKGLTLKMALFPCKEEIYNWVLEGKPEWTSRENPSGFSAVLSELAEERGIDFVDLKPAFISRAREAYEDSGTLLWWRDDTHFNNEGHRVAAQLLYEEYFADRSR